MIERLPPANRNQLDRQNRGRSNAPAPSKSFERDGFGMMMPFRDQPIEKIHDEFKNGQGNLFREMDRIHDHMNKRMKSMMRGFMGGDPFKDDPFFSEIGFGGFGGHGKMLEKAEKMMS